MVQRLEFKACPIYIITYYTVFSFGTNFAIINNSIINKKIVIIKEAFEWIKK